MIHRSLTTTGVALIHHTTTISGVPCASYTSLSAALSSLASIAVPCFSHSFPLFSIYISFLGVDTGFSRTFHRPALDSFIHNTPGRRRLKFISFHHLSYRDEMHTYHGHGALTRTSGDGYIHLDNDCISGRTWAGIVTTTIKHHWRLALYSELSTSFNIASYSVFTDFRISVALSRSLSS